MKKFLLLLSTVLLLTSCNAQNNTSNNNSNNNQGGSGNVTVAKKDSDTSESNTNQAKNETKENEELKTDEILNSLTTTAYTWSDSYRHYAALIIKNNSSSNIKLKANISFKNSDGSLVGATNEYIYAFEANTETCLVVNNEEAFTDISYDYEVDKNSYICQTSALSCEVTPLKEKAVLSITNNSESTVKSVYYKTLFFQGGNVIDFNWGFIDDLQAGKTLAEESNTYGKDYDEVKVFLQGYSIN